MSEKITREIFDHLVALAALELDEQQSEYLRGELNGQLKAIGELEAIELDQEIPIASHGVGYQPETSAELRLDVVEDCVEADLILAQAPKTEGRYIVVPDIPHEELE